MIGIIELGASDEIAVYVVGGDKAAVHHFVGHGLPAIHEKLRCAGYLIDKGDWDMRLWPGGCDKIGVKAVENLRHMIRAV